MGGIICISEITDISPGNLDSSLCFIQPSISHKTSLVAQMVKHLPTMQETWIQSLGWEDPLEKEMATHSSILACNPMNTVYRVAKGQTRLSDSTSLLHSAYKLNKQGDNIQP